jgi:predicted nuclease with TOPRIM domain
MSQTETLMLVALGFVAAIFIALVVGRSLWKLARGIQSRKLRSEIPLVVAELKADRDRLRAELAMQMRKFDAGIVDLKVRLAEQMAEVARHRNRLELLAGASKQLEAQLAERESEARGVREQLASLEAELAKRTESSQRLEDQVREKDETISRLNREIVAFKEILSEQELELAMLEERAGGRPHPPADDPGSMAAREDLERRIEDLTALSQQIADQRAQFMQERENFSTQRQAIAFPAAPRSDNGQEHNETGVIDERGRAIEEKLAAAELESQALALELESLDAAWTKKVDGIEHSAEPTFIAGTEKTAKPAGESVATQPDTAAQKQRAAGNVVSLAARIRALQRDATN